MQISLQQLERDVATEIINIGLCEAADSLSFFTKEKVLIKGFDYALEKITDYQITGKNSSEIHLLSSEIKGEMSGYCFLLFTTNEVNSLHQISLPEPVLNDSERLLEMGKAILLEVKNIITASVVTHFSNLLGYKMHGYIPELETIPASALADKVFSKIQKYDYVLHFRATFLSSGHNIEPEFIWTLDEKFIEGVKNIVNNDHSLKKLRQNL